jgi:hypothetical protein
VDSSDDLRVQSSSNSAPPGFSVSAQKPRAVLITTDASSESDSILFAANVDEPGDHAAQVVQSQTGFSAGYFTCGSDVLDTTQFSPVISDEYTTVCRENGVVGQVLFLDPYYFTQADAATFAISQATGRCAALSEPIAETIADLPPYSCSRTIHPSFLACFATAAANTQLLFQVLVFLSALALSRLAARFPPKQSLRGTAAPAAAPASIEMAGISTFAGTGAYVRDVENPMV